MRKKGWVVTATSKSAAGAAAAAPNKNAAAVFTTQLADAISRKNNAHSLRPWLWYTHLPQNDRTHIGDES